MDARPTPLSPRRSFLFSPGDSPRKMQKAAGLPADTVILDLEDGVAPAQKSEARTNVVEALSRFDFGGTERLVRLNAEDTPFFEDDLRAIVPAGPDGLVLPKVESAAQLERVERYLLEHPAGALPLFAFVETAAGILNVAEIARATPLLAALLLGAEDLAVDLGAIRTGAGREILYARSAIVMAAAANGLQSVDTVFLDLAGLPALENEARFARELGFTGKLAIHPAQVPVLNQVFSPSQEEIAQARRLLSAFETHLAAGSGVFALDGRMVDRPLVRGAERVLERARLCGLVEP